MKNRIFTLLMTGVMLISILSSCGKKTKEDKMLELGSISLESEKASVSNINNTNVDIISEETFTYKTSTIPIENDIDGINQIIEKDGIIYGVGYVSDEDWNSSTMLFSVDIKTASVHYYSYSLPPYSDVVNLAVNKENELFFIESSYEDGYEYQSEYKSYALHMIDKEGNLQLSVDMNEYLSWEYPPELVFDNSGNLFIQTYDSILVFSKDCALLFDIDLDIEQYVYYPMFSLYDDTIVIPLNMNHTITLYSVGMETKKLQPITEFPISGNSLIYAGHGEDAEIYAIDESAIYSYSLKSGEKQFVMDLLGRGFNYIQANYWCILSSEQMALLYYNERNNTTDITILTKSNEPQKPRQIITLATYWADVYTISEFNRKNETYQVELIDYYEHGTDYKDAQARLYADILSGNGPDMLNFHSMEYENYADSGVLADLYPFFEKDQILNVDALIEGVTKALSIDGKLLAMTPEFTVSTIMGVSSIVGSHRGMSIDELIQLETNLGEGTKLFNQTSNTGFVSILCTANWEHFIDYEQGSAHFNSEEFIRILEFADRFAEPIPEQGGVLPLLTEEEALMQGSAVLSHQGFSYFGNLHVFETSIGKDFTLMGFHSAGNSMVKMGAEKMYGICNNAANPDGAWEFIKYLLSEEFQQNKVFQFPVLESIYDKDVEYWTDPAFSKSTDPNLGDRGPGMTQDQVDEVYAMIASMTGPQKYYTPIMEIINTEVAAFFSGDKSAEATAETINSRVGVLLNERL